MIMNLTAFNVMMFMINSVIFNIWFWTMRPDFGKIFVILILIWTLPNLWKLRAHKK